MSATSTRATVRRDELRELPPGARLVAKVLEYNGTLSPSDIAEKTLLPARTVRDAVGRREDRGVVTSRHSFSDARKRLYRLAE
ncbi:MAG: ArsR family transcriptional regulator [Halanaeroarchaeum sp.]